MVMPLRPGFTIIEIMISLSIMAIGIMAVVGQMSTLDTARARDRNSLAIDLLLNEMQERFQGCRWEVLGSTSLPWSLQRNSPSTTLVGATERQAMDDVSAAADQNLVSMGLLSGPSGIPGLKVYVEYYRALAVRADDGTITTPGMMDGEGTNFNGLVDLRALWNDPSRTTPSVPPAPRLPYRLDAGSSPTTQVAENDPLLIRIEIQATGIPSRVLYTGRKK